MKAERDFFRCFDWRVMVLAAGFGTRLGALTDEVPKPLVKVAGREMLSFSLDRLRLLRPSALVVNGHYRSRLLADWLTRHGAGFRRLVYLHEPGILDTGGGIANAAAYLGGDFFITINADVVSNLALAPAVRYHLRRRALVTMIMHDNVRFNQVEVDENLRIRAFGGRPRDHRAGRRQLAYTGIQICSSVLLPLLRRQGPGPFPLIESYRSLLSAGRRDLFAFVVDTDRQFYWRDLGRPEDLQALETDLGRSPDLAASLGAY